MKRIEIGLPNLPNIYEEIEIIAKPSDSYNPQEVADKVAGFLYELPHAVVEKVLRDRRFKSTIERLFK